MSQVGLSGNGTGAPSCDVCDRFGSLDRGLYQGICFECWTASLDGIHDWADLPPQVRKLHAAAEKMAVALVEILALVARVGVGDDDRESEPIVMKMVAALKAAGKLASVTGEAD